MNELNQINPQYPCQNVAIPHVILHDSSEMEIKIIDQMRNELKQKLFDLDASEVLNVLKKHFISYPYSSLRFDISDEYDDDGQTYESFIVKTSSTDKKEETMMIASNVSSMLTARLTTYTYIFHNLNTNIINKSNFNDCAKQLLPQHFDTWFLGKVGLEQQKLDSSISMVHNSQGEIENKKYKL
jgi:hypothetical protein